MVDGFDADATRRLSNEIRGAGHQVLGALGRHGARTFLRALVPELVVIPTEDATRVREWTSDLGLTGLVFMEVPQKAPDGAGQQVLRRFAGEPEPEAFALRRNAERNDHRARRRSHGRSISA